MRIIRLMLVTVVLALSGTATSVLGAYPDRPVHIIVPTVPGGSGDAVARIIAEELSEKWGQPVLVANKPGAGMTLGLLALEKAAPDGYTLGIGPRGPIIIGPTIPDGLPFDPRIRLTPIAKIASVPIVLVANKEAQLRSVTQLIDAAKAAKHPLTFASPGQYTSHRVAVELLARQSHVSFVHVPYRGGGQAITDLLGGQVPFAALDLTAVQEHLKTGQLIPLATPRTRRLKLSPGIPTLAEEGHPIEPVDSWLGVFGPRNLPPDIAQKLADDLGEIFRRPAAQRMLARAGLELEFEDSARFARSLDAEARAWEALRLEVLPELRK